IHQKDDGLVMFATKQGSGVFDVAKRQWRSRGGTFEASVVPGDLAAHMAKHGMLEAVVRFLFGGKALAGEPVKSAAEPRDGGMQVFDYAQDPSKQWARIWVLRQSRLPIRIKLFNPSDDEVIVVSFDYSSPQPDSFFDIGHFDKHAQSVYVDKPHQFYQIGKQPVGGKPQDARQVFRTKGITPPRLLDIVTTQEHHILLVTDRPDNRSVHGGHLADEYYEELHDNWGNLYRRYYDGTFAHPNRHKNAQYYVPIPPFMQGQGKHTLTLLYTAWSHHVGEDGPGYDKLLYSEDVEVPAPTAGGIPKGWPGSEPGGRGGDMRFWIHQAFRLHYSTSRPPLEQLRMVDPLLKESPESGQLLDWKMNVLEELGGPEPAAEFFQRHMKEDYLAKAYQTGSFGQAVSRWLGYELRKGRLDVVLPIIEKTAAARSRVLKEHAGNERELERLRDSFGYDPATTWMKLPAGLKSVAGGPKPAVEKIVRSNDGYLFVVLGGPEGHPAADVPGLHRSFHFEPHPGGTWQSRRPRPHYTMPGWAGLRAAGRTLVILRGNGEKLALRLWTPLDPKDINVSPPIQVPYELTLDVPAASPQSFEEVSKQFAEFFLIPKGLPPFRFALRQAFKHYLVQEYAEAVPWFRQALAAPDEQPIADMEDQEKAVLYRLRDRLWAMTETADCLCRLGRLDESLALLDQIKTKLPPKDEQTAWLHRQAEGHVIAGRAAAAAYLMEAGRLDEAEAMLDAINADRPDFRLLHNRHGLEKKPWSTGRYRPRRHAAGQWAPVDRAMWKLQQARRAQKAEA
ncbi:MAG: hypothetical protein AMJ81_09000, partial [Phycisphaerae bacterium SM23_33]